MTGRRLAAGVLVALGLSACQATGTVPPQAQQPTSSRSAATTATTATPSASPTPTLPSCPGTACVTITVTGDVLLHPPLWAQAHRDAAGRGGYDFTDMLAAQRPLLAASDLAFCHLETPLAAPGGPFRGYPSFSVPPQIATALRRTGSARSPSEASHPLTFDVRGARVALLSYTYGLNGISPDHAWRVNLIDAGRIRQAAHAARRAGADVVVVALHWGIEYHHDPTGQQRSLADELLADPDIDLVYGHHAHVVQPVQRLHGKWVVYGLGNAIAAQTTNRSDTYRGLLVRVQLVRGSSGRWRGGRLDWVASGISTSPAYRWADLSRVPSAVAATRRYVDALGAGRQGASPWIVGSWRGRRGRTLTPTRWCPAACS